MYDNNIIIQVSTKLNLLDKNLVTEKIYKLSKKLLLEINKEESKDHDLIELLIDLGGVVINDYKTYNLPDNSIIFYFPTVHMIKSYKVKELNNFLYDVGAYFKNKEFLEVVKDVNKQKIVIIYDTANDTEIEKLVYYIINFIMDIYNIHITYDDIIIIIDKNNQTSEFILNKYVNNIQEKNLFCKHFIQYIKSYEKNTKLSRKINMDINSIFKKANCYNSINKILNISDSTKNNILKKVKNAIITDIENYDNAELHIISYDIKNIYNISNYDKFVTNIKINKPSWFKANNWQHQYELYNKYIFIYKPVSSKMFTIQMKGRIFNIKTSKWINGINRIAYKLFNWNQIQ